MKKKIQIILCCMILLISTVGISGCSSKTKKETPMGRYEETEVELPKELGEFFNIINIGYDEENHLKILVCTEHLVEYTRQEDGSYSSSSEMDEWFKKANGGKKFDDMVYGKSKSGTECIATNTYQDETTSEWNLYRKTTDGNYEKIEAKELNEKNEFDFVSYIEKILIDENDNVYVCRYDDVICYDRDGKYAWEISDINGSTAELNQGCIWAIDQNDGNKVIAYDITTKNKKETIEFTSQENEKDEVTYGKSETILGVSGDNTLLLQNRKGIFELGEGRNIWINQIDSSMNSMSLPSINVQKIIRAQDGKYGLLYIDENREQHILEYLFNPEIPSEPEKSISIYSLRESESLRHAIVHFQKANPEVKINYYVAMENDETGDSTEYIKALNTELLSQGGPDILVLDGMDPKEYWKNGMLEDISDIIQPMIESNDITDQTANTFSENKKIYAMPTKLKVPIIYGDNEDVEKVKTLDGMIQYLKENSFSEYVGKVGFAKCMYQLYGRELFGTDGTLMEENIQKYFDIAENISVAEYELNENVGMYGAIHYKDTKIGYEALASGGFAQMICDYLTKHKDTTIYSNETFVPKNILGVNKVSKEKELAKKFIAYVLSLEEQAAAIKDGMPMNVSALSNLIMKDEEKNKNQDAAMNFCYYESSGRSFDENISWPTQQQLEQLKDIYKNLKDAVMENTEKEKKLIDYETQILEKQMTSEKAFEEYLSFIKQRSEE